MRKSMLTIIAILSVFQLKAFAAEGTRIDENHNVVLSTAMATALKSFDGNFQILDFSSFAVTVQGYFGASEAPMAALADFNQDKLRDAVVMGTTGKGLRVLVAIISSAKGYRALQIESVDFNDPKTAKFGKESGLSQYLSVGSLRGRTTLQFENALSLAHPVVSFLWNGRQFVFAE